MFKMYFVKAAVITCPIKKNIIIKMFTVYCYLKVAVITCTHYSSIQSIINGLKEDDFYSGWWLFNESNDDFLARESKLKDMKDIK